MVERCFHILQHSYSWQVANNGKWCRPRQKAEGEAMLFGCTWWTPLWLGLMCAGASPLIPKHELLRMQNWNTGRVSQQIDINKHDPTHSKEIRGAWYKCERVVCSSPRIWVQLGAIGRAPYLSCFLHCLTGLFQHIFALTAAIMVKCRLGANLEVWKPLLVQIYTTQKVDNHT